MAEEVVMYTTMVAGFVATYAWLRWLDRKYPER